MHRAIPASFWCWQGTSCEAVIELFLIPFLDADAFQLREPRSRRPAQHTIHNGWWLPTSPRARPEWSSWAGGVQLHVCGDSHDLPDKVYIARMAGGDQSQENMSRGPRKFPICTRAARHEDNLNVSTRRVMYAPKLRNVRSVTGTPLVKMHATPPTKKQVLRVAGKGVDCRWETSNHGLRPNVNLWK